MQNISIPNTEMPGKAIVSVKNEKGLEIEIFRTKEDGIGMTIHGENVVKDVHVSENGNINIYNIEPPD